NEVHILIILPPEHLLPYNIYNYIEYMLLKEDRDSISNILKINNLITEIQCDIDGNRSRTKFKIIFKLLNNNDSSVNDRDSGDGCSDGNDGSVKSSSDCNVNNDNNIDNHTKHTTNKHNNHIKNNYVILSLLSKYLKEIKNDINTYKYIIDREYKNKEKDNPVDLSVLCAE
ncbi:hypothetical protein SLOPH_604, partial [Spraguea lophii 42_110]